MTPKRKFFLFKQSDHFCSVPWNHIKVDMEGNITTCVNGEVLLGNIHADTIENILLNPKLSLIKTNLVNDVVDTNCKRCQAEELHETDYKFLRNLYNPLFKSSEVDYDDANSFVLGGIDLHWSSICDLKCITCWEKQSSSIAIEMSKPILHTTNKAADQLIAYIVANQQHLREIYLSGGEPTLIKHNLKLLQKLDKNQNFTIRINTNLMFEKTNQIINELLKFPKVLMTISADAMGDRFDYIRRGASWDKFLANLDWLSNTHVDLRLNSVFFIASAPTLVETQEFFYKTYGITDFTINQCIMDHPDLASRNLKQEVKSECLAKLKQHQENFKENKNLYSQLSNCILELEQIPVKSYKEYFNQIDNLAGTDWKLTFPELV